MKPAEIHSGPDGGHYFPLSMPLMLVENVLCVYGAGGGGALHICELHILRFNQPGPKSIFPENSKKQNLNFPQIDNYLYCIYIVFT